MFDVCPIGSQWAFMVLVSDGISSVVSDQEIVDLARGATSPKHAAKRILSFAEEMGSSDNLTAIVLPFAGWGHVSGPDQTKNLRAYRSSQMSQSFVLFSGISFLIILQLVLSGRGGCNYPNKSNCRLGKCTSASYAPEMNVRRTPPLTLHIKFLHLPFQIEHSLLTIATASCTISVELHGHLHGDQIQLPTPFCQIRL